MIEILNLKKEFSKHFSLIIPFLEIKKGEIVCIMGKNGSGKTTLFRLILDLILPEKGEILFTGKNVSKSEDWKLKTASYIDEDSLIDYLTPKEFINFLLKIKGKNQIVLTDYPHMQDTLNSRQYIRELSKGNKQKVGMFSCFIQNPEVMILDESFSNLDPSAKILFKDELKKINHQNKTTILFSTHDIDVTLSICSRVIILDKGAIIFDEYNIDTEKLSKKLHSFFS